MRCVCCLHEEISYQYTLRDLSFGEDGQWDFVCCNQCGHGFLFPIPTEGELVTLYTNLYSKEKKEQMIKMGKGDFDQSLQHRRARMLAESLVGQDIRCIVDVGCGMGFSLENSHKMAIFSEYWFRNVSHRGRRGSKIEG